MQILESIMENDFIAFVAWIATMIFLAIVIYLIIPGPNGQGTYTGFLVTTHDKGLIFKTKGATIRSPLNDAESFCIVDPAIYAQLNAIPRQTPIQVTYQEKSYTGSWQCDFWDSNKIITSIKEET